MDIFESIQQIFSDGTSEVSSNTVTDDLELMAELYHTYFTEPLSELTPVPMALTPVTSGGYIQEEPKAPLPHPNPMSSTNLSSQSIHPSQFINSCRTNSDTTVHTSWDQSLDTTDINARQNREEYAQTVQFNYSIQEEPKAPLPHPNPMSSMNLSSQSIHPSQFINSCRTNSDTTVHTSWDQSLDTTDINARQNREEYAQTVQFNYSIQEEPKAPLPHPNPMSSMNLSSQSIHPSQFINSRRMNSDTTVHTSWNQTLDTTDINAHQNREEYAQTVQFNYSSIPSSNNGYAQKFSDAEELELELEKKKESEDDSNCVSSSSSSSTHYTNKKKQDTLKTSQPSSNDRKKNGRPKRQVGYPKRPLSAYNLFFKDERKRLLKTMPKNEQLMPFPTNTITSTNRRKGRAPPHHKISFSHLGKQIGHNWNIAPEIVKGKYNLLAVEEKRKYDEKLREFKNKKLKQLKQSGIISTASESNVKFEE